jgi:6-phosphogluconolactonase
VFRAPDAVADAAVELLAEEAAAAIQARGRFSIALSGGTTPRLLYERMGRTHATRFDWSRIHLFWSDERCVPEGDPASNYELVHETLLVNVPIPPANVHRIRGEHPDPHGAAIEYDRLLKKFFSFAAAAAPRFDGSGRAPDDTPAGLRGDRAAGARTTFDVVLLGLGEDGHTASLFPGDPIVEEKRHWVYAVRAPKGVAPTDRVTLTLPAINASGRAIFLVTGERKRGVFAAIREGSSAASRSPAARVTAVRGVTWLIDRAAAGMPSS